MIENIKPDRIQDPEVAKAMSKRAQEIAVDAMLKNALKEAIYARDVEVFKKGGQPKKMSDEEINFLLSGLDGKSKGTAN